MLMKSAWMRVTALDSIAALLIKRGKVTGSAAAAAYPDNRSQLNQQHNQRSKKLHTHNHSIFSSLHHNTLQLTVQQQRRHFSASPHARDATSTPSAAAAAAVADGSGGGSGLGVFDTLQGGLESMHVVIGGATGMPFAGTIIVSTVLLRFLLTLPPTIYQHQVLARYTRLQPTIKQWTSAIQHKVIIESKRARRSADETNTLIKAGVTEKRLELTQREFGQFLFPIWMVGQEKVEKYSLVLRSQGVHLLQIPLWVSMSLMLRRLGDPALTDPLLFDQLCNGGMLWFSNLAIPDVWYGLPLVAGIANLTNIEINGLIRHARLGAQREEASKMTTTLRGLSLAMVWVGSTVPSALCLFWATSSVYGVAQNLLMQVPAVRDAFDIPRVESDKAAQLKQLPKHAKDAFSDFASEVRDKNKT